MKNIIFILLAFFIAGCSAQEGGLKNYIEEPRWFLKDPHYAAYQKKQDDLESEFLQRTITYAEYIQRREVLEETYEKEIQERSTKTAPSLH